MEDAEREYVQQVCLLLIRNVELDFYFPITPVYPKEAKTMKKRSNRAISCLSN